MKTPLITVLSIVGVIATAGAAMAINSDALTTASNQTIGGATEVLVPVDNYSVVPDPSASPTATAAPDATAPPATSAEPVEPSAPAVASPAPVRPKPTSSPTATSPSPTPTPTRTPRYDDDEHDD